MLLSAPIEVNLDRVADRANPFGSKAEDRTKIANDLVAFEPLLRAGADREIVTTMPVIEVVAALEEVANREPRKSSRPALIVRTHRT